MQVWRESLVPSLLAFGSRLRSSERSGPETAIATSVELHAPTAAARRACIYRRVLRYPYARILPFSRGSCATDGVCLSGGADRISAHRQDISHGFLGLARRPRDLSVCPKNNGCGALYGVRALHGVERQSQNCEPNSPVRLLH